MTTASKKFTCDVCKRDDFKNAFGLSGHMRSHGMVETAKARSRQLHAGPAPAPSEELPPGSVVGEGLGQTTVQWTMDWIRKHNPDVEFTPAENISITYQGVRMDFVADRTVMVPRPFKGIYDDMRKARADKTIWRQQGDQGLDWSPNNQGGVSRIGGAGFIVHEQEGA